MSTAELTLRGTKAFAIIAITIWELVQLARHRDDLPLRVLAPGLVCLSFAATLGINTPLLDPVQDAFGESWRYLVNGAWSTMAFCFATYFLLANPAVSVERRKRKALVELGLLCSALVVMVVVHEAAPDTWERPMTAEQYRSPANIIWYLSVDGYALIAWIVGVRRAGALRRRLHHPWARSAFWLVIAGSTLMTLGVNGISLLRQLVRCVDPNAGRGGLMSTLYSTGQLGGQFMLAIGLALVPLATAALAVRERRAQRQRGRYTRQLEKLHRTLVAEFPHIALYSGTADAQDNPQLGQMTTEITEGFAELARDCPPPAGDLDDPQVVAAAVADGLSRRAEQRRTGTDPDHEPPYPRIEPDFADWREQARWMISISKELQRRGLLIEKDPARAR